MKNGEISRIAINTGGGDAPGHGNVPLHVDIGAGGAAIMNLLMGLVTASGTDDDGNPVSDSDDAVVGFAEAHGMNVKGHALVWHGSTPQWVEELSPPELRMAMEDHIRTVMGHYRGRVAVWDVVNEAVNLVPPFLQQPELFRIMRDYLGF